MSTWMANSASYWFRANFNFVIDGYEDTTAWGTATFFFEEVETTVGKKKFAVAKKKVAVAKKKVAVAKKDFTMRKNVAESYMLYGKGFQNGLF